MKAFEQYLAEAQKEYSFRLRCACDLTEDHMHKIENRLKKYEAFSVSNPKKTMFQSSPPGFSHLSGGEIHIVDFKTRQPVAPHVLHSEISECCDISESLVRVKNAGDLDMEETPEASDNTKDSSEAILEQPYEKSDNSHAYGPKLIGNLLGDLAKVARKNEFAGSDSAAKSAEVTEENTTSPIGS
tara:strand:+ start:2500 stop:3054 length:555 start_codon:yes stop_codon:yes gene_type:complete